MRRPSHCASWLATSSPEGASALSPTVSRRAEHILSQLKSELPGKRSIATDFTYYKLESGEFSGCYDFRSFLACWTESR